MAPGGSAGYGIFSWAPGRLRSEVGRDKCGMNGCQRFSQLEVNDLDGTVAVAGPDFHMATTMNGYNAIRAGVIGASQADEVR